MKRQLQEERHDAAKGKFDFAAHQMYQNTPLLSKEAGCFSLYLPACLFCKSPIVRRGLVCQKRSVHTPTPVAFWRTRHI